MKSEEYHLIIKELESVGGISINGRFLKHLTCKFKHVARNTLHSIIEIWYRRRVMEKSRTIPYDHIYNLYKNLVASNTVDACLKISHDLSYPPALISKIILTRYVKEVQDIRKNKELLESLKLRNVGNTKLVLHSDNANITNADEPIDNITKSHIVDERHQELDDKFKKLLLRTEQCDHNRVRKFSDTKHKFHKDQPQRIPKDSFEIIKGLNEFEQLQPLVEPSNIRTGQKGTNPTKRKIKINNPGKSHKNNNEIKEFQTGLADEITSHCNDGDMKYSSSFLEKRDQLHAIDTRTNLHIVNENHQELDDKLKKLPLRTEQCDRNRVHKFSDTKHKLHNDQPQRIPKDSFEIIKDPNIMEQLQPLVEPSDTSTEQKATYPTKRKIRINNTETSNQSNNEIRKLADENTSYCNNGNTKYLPSVLEKTDKLETIDTKLNSSPLDEKGSQKYRKCRPVKLPNAKCEIGNLEINQIVEGPNREGNESNSEQIVSNADANEIKVQHRGKVKPMYLVNTGICRKKAPLTNEDLSKAWKKCEDWFFFPEDIVTTTDRTVKKSDFADAFNNVDEETTSFNQGDDFHIWNDVISLDAVESTYTLNKVVRSSGTITNIYSLNDENKNQINENLEGSFELYTIEELYENPSVIGDDTLYREILSCNRQDDYYGPEAAMYAMNSGQWYEEKLELCAKELNMMYRTEGRSREIGTDKTPDISLIVPVAIGNFIINWIESKAIFADEQTHKAYIESQYNSYLNRFGPGLVIYWFGFIEDMPNLQNSGIIVRDRFPEKNEFTFLDVQDGLKYCHT